MTAPTPISPARYPVQAVFAPAGDQSRVTIFFRILLAIPAFIVLFFIAIAGFVVTFIAWWCIVIAGTFPAGLFRFAVGTHRWSLRVTAYMYLMTVKYPPFSLEDDTAYPVRFEAVEDTTGRNRLTTFFRIILVIPHAIVVGLLSYAARAVAFVCWLIGIFTGRLPDGLHNFLAGYLRWSIRVQAYEGLITDRYPPFSMSENS